VQIQVLRKVKELTNINNKEPFNSLQEAVQGRLQNLDQVITAIIIISIIISNQLT